MLSPRDTLKDRKPRRKAPALENFGATESLVHIPIDVFEDAEAMMTMKVGASSFDITTSQLISALMHESGKLVKRGRHDHIEALSEAYATYAFLKEAPDFLNYISEIASDLDIRIIPTTSPLRIILQSKIYYEDDGAKTSASKLYSRDVQAIRYLIDRSIKPSEVLILSREKGQGLDYWSRNAPSKIRPAKTKSKRFKNISCNLDSVAAGHSLHFILNGEDFRFDVSESDREGFVLFLNMMAQTFRPSRT